MKMKLNKKHSKYSVKLIGLVVIIFVVAVIFLIMAESKQSQDTRQRAAAATSLQLTPNQITSVVDSQFILQTQINTGTNQVIGAEIYVSYDPSYLQALSIDKGTFFPTVLDSKISSGSAFIALVADVLKPLSGTGIASSITFKTLKATSNPIVVMISNNSKIADVVDPNNVLESTIPSQVSITTMTLQSPSPRNSPFPSLMPSSSACKIGTQLFSMNTPCRPNKWFSYATYTCYDGLTGQIGSSNQCHTDRYWKGVVDQICSGRSSCTVSSTTF